MEYSVQAGRILTAQKLVLDAGDMAKLRDTFNAALQKHSLISTSDK